MRSVNLLPDDRRPRSASAGGSDAGYWMLAVLAVLVVAVGAYVHGANQVTDTKAELTEVERETAQAEARGASLAAFGDFTQVKATRMASVSQLAQSRFDWERFVRELAHVLPVHSWLTDVDASSIGGEGDGAAAGAAAGAPAAQLKGCARDQQDVATLMVRLRRLYRAQEVDLVDSSRNREAGSGPCAGRYKFDIKVTFAPIATAQDVGRVSAALGGGQ
jgi:Tfp pilus assembly protein PilN